ncbi:MAG: S9 family peptidase, partial [Bacteroidales bacterium]|nr:S9 family peptidase [Bacteroidales bacterium]
FYFTSENKVFVYNFDDEKLLKVNEYPEEAENIEIDYNTFSVAYTIGNNLFVAINGDQIAVSDESDADILFGHVPSRNEFGISNGSFWSPDGSLLAFYRTDQTKVTKYPLVDIFQPIAKADPISYPMAGEKSQEVQLGVFNPGLNQITYIATTGPQNQYLTSVSWNPDGKYLFIGLLNRDQNHLEMNKYDAISGKFIKTLFEEKNERYVEPLHDLYFLSKNPEQFVWQSRRDGWNHLYLYTVEGEMISQITKGEWEVTNLIGFDEGEKNVYYESTQASPIERHLYKTDLKKHKTEKLTTAEGTHNIVASKGKDYFIDIFSSVSMARAYYVLGSDGKMLNTLLEDVDPWKDYKIGEMEIFTLKADDGATDLYCRLIKPAGFDPAKKYPVLVYTYGGPHAQLIDNSWTGGAGFWLNLMAQQGYVVFTLDNRGSANRGFEFESIIHRRCGEKEMADQMTGVEYLKTLDYVDADKMGVDGWSYGGFLTTSLFLRNPGVFKVACAGGPVIDWKWYEVMYGERYMDTPLQNPEGYEKAKVLNYVENLEGNLLIIHGTNDPVVMWQNSLTFLDECIKQGKQVDYFVYPGAEHNMRGQARVHMFEKITNYFNDHLKFSSK